MKEKKATLKKVVASKEIDISSVSRISGGETDEYGKVSSCDLPGVQIFIGTKDGASIIAHLRHYE